MDTFFNVKLKICLMRKYNFYTHNVGNLNTKKKLLGF